MSERVEYDNVNGNGILFEIISKSNEETNGRDYSKEIKEKDRVFFIRLNKTYEYKIQHSDIRKIIGLLLDNDIKDDVFKENLYDYLKFLGKKEGERNEST